MQKQLTKVPQKKYPLKKGLQPVIQIKKNRYSDVLGLAIIILLGIIIYSNSFDCSFHFDDFPNISNNPKIFNLSDVKAWWNFYPTRPIGIFSFVLNYHFNQLDVWYYHLVNLIIHLINACLVWWLTLLIFSSPALKDQPIAGNRKVLAFFTALLFVSHPLTTQSVTYIVQRLASMVAMFYFLSLILYIKGRLSTKGSIPKSLLFIGSVVSAALAMMTKENAFTLPFAILLFEFFFLRPKKLSINFKDYRVILLTAALLGMIIIIPLKFSFSIFRPIPPMLGHAYTITSRNYLLTQFSVIVKYIRLLFLPVNQTFEYDFPISNSFFEIRTLLSFGILLSFTVLAIFSFKRYRIISFGILWFFLTLSIESGFIPIADVIYEHRTYLPSFGFFLILTSGIYYLFWNKHKYFVISIFSIIIVANSYLTFERNKVWKDELSFWNDNVTKNPNLPRPLSNRGAAYSHLEQWDKAIADYSRAIEFYPEFPEAYYNRANAYGNLGQWDKAITDFSRAIRIDPKFTKAYYNRGNLYVQLNQWEKAIIDFSKATEIEPDNANAYDNRGVAYGNLGQWENAITDFSKSIGIDPNNARSYSNRGIAYSNLGKWDKAITDYTTALGIDPNNSVASSNREIAYSKLHSDKK
jgi:Flp pilus assembly protein TadD